MSAVHWFRKGLRLHDNPALVRAVEVARAQNLSLRPVFVLDPWFVSSSKTGANRWRFLAQALRDLDAQLRDKLKSRLFVLRGKPDQVWTSLFKVKINMCILSCISVYYLRRSGT